MNPLICSSFRLRRILVMLTAIFVTVVSTHAQTLTVLHTFTSRPDGLTPIGGVIMDGFGRLLGTTAQGGTGTQGTVFMIDASGNETVLHSFVNRPDGLDPEAGLVIDEFNNLYGTTELGGSQGKGTIFMVTPGGLMETVLHSFTCCPPLGKNPVAGLIFDAAGNLYGTAQNGGDQAQDGTVFKLGSPGVLNELTALHVFNARAGDGRNPRGRLFFDHLGNLYGTTYQGGTQDQGTVFEIDNAGNYRVLHSFSGGADGKWPRAGVIMDQFGNLWGTTSNGGAFNGGTVFIIPADRTGEFVVHDFGASGDGQWPYGGLAIDANGNLYGTTVSGGAFAQQGTVFTIAPAGDNSFSYAVLHSFNGNDGASPAAGVIVGPDGNLYGTCSQGGPGNGFHGTGGTVWKLSLH
jgi:uncharacterized repeat protein (TIGR03803 family)